MDKTKTCPYCQGSGKDPKGTGKCPVCRGRKKIKSTLMR